MRVPGLIMIGLSALCIAATEPPKYEEDPFNDGDFTQAPKLLNVTYPTDSRFEVGLMFSSSLTDRYTSHIGGMVDVSYFFNEHWGVGVTGGIFNGQLTSIVTDDAGILGNSVTECRDKGGAFCDNINPNVPDYKQITGLVDAVAYWVPLYGKINFVSELDASLNLYLLAGAGVNGTRVVRAEVLPGASQPSDYRLTNNKFGDGGFFSNTKFNMTAGGGLKIYLADFLALRGEVRMLVFRDQFEFEAGQGKEGYFSTYYFGQTGVSLFF